MAQGCDSQKHESGVEQVMKLRLLMRYVRI